MTPGPSFQTTPARVAPGDVEVLLRDVEHADRLAEPGPDAVVVHAGGHHEDEDLARAGLRGRPSSRAGTTSSARRGALCGSPRRPSPSAPRRAAGRAEGRTSAAVAACGGGHGVLLSGTVARGTRHHFALARMTQCDTRTSAMESRDRPWIMRTYSGHSTPEASNALYRRNLAKGQTGLSVAFDLPTQTGYDPDHPLAAGEVGKVGVPVAHLGDMRALFDGIPIEKMNTSMTINATAPWLLALYVALAGERGVDPKLPQRDDAERHPEGVPLARARSSSRRATRSGSRATSSRTRSTPSPSGTRSTSAATTCRRPERRPCRSSPTRSRRRSRVLDTVKDAPRASRRRRGDAARRRADLVLRQRGGPVHRGDVQAPRVRRALGPAARASATASPTRSSGAFVTACRSTRSGSPRRSRRTTSSGSSSRCSRSFCRRTRARARCSSRRGTRRSGCRARGTSSGASGRSRSWRSRPTCSTTRTSSTAARSSRRR